MRNRLYPAAHNITLEDLLRRRRTSLARYLSGGGIDTYDALVRRCASLGVTAPSREAYEAAHPNWVTSPAEGVVVVPPPPAPPSPPPPPAGSKKKRAAEAQLPAEPAAEQPVPEGSDEP